MKKLLLMGLITLGTSTMAFACPPDKACPVGPQFRPACHKPHCCPPPKCNIAEELQLTDEQKAQAKELRLKARAEMKPIFEAIKTKYEQKEIIKRNRNMTAEAQCEQVEKLNNEISALKNQLHDLRVQNKKDFEAILTPEQKEKLKKIKQQARKDRAKNFQKKGPKCKCKR